MGALMRKRVLHIVATTCLWFGGTTVLHAGSGGRSADTSSAGTTVDVVPGSRYQAGWLHSILLGEHWRSLWTDTISVPVLQCDRFAGGLTPVKRGGGMQTKSLRFRGNDGREYKFRSVDKDPAQSLPPDLKESIAADVLQDQISSSNPFAPMIVS